MTVTRHPLEQLPGDLMIWVLIVSELLVFGAGLAAFLAVRATDPQGFALAQDALHRVGGGMNTIVLLTSGYLTARAVAAIEIGEIAQFRRLTFGASALGLVFLAIKAVEFRDLARQGISTETHPFYTFYYLLTGFHAAHVVVGILAFWLILITRQRLHAEAAAAFWHMVDLVWVLLFPVIYLLR